MKVLVIVFSSLFFSLNTGFSQENEKSLDSQLIKQISQTLHSGHSELVTFQLSTILQLASKHGVESVKLLKVSISSISVNSKDSELRYLAFLTLEALNSPDLIKNLPKYPIDQTEAVFKYIQDSIITYAFNSK